MSAGLWQLGVDIGGTFTDVVALHPESGRVRAAKVPSRPEAPVAGLVAALEAVGIRWEEAADLVHGTTLVTNAVVENRLADVALVATEGFADTLAIGRQNRRHLYRLDVPPKAAPQIAESRRLEVRERLDARGEVLVALDEEALDALARELAACGVDAVAVSLLHAYANPAHEERVAERLGGMVPHVALSHRVSPEAREYERTATTALSAGLMPLAARFVDDLEARRPETSHVHLFHSAGGMAAPEVVRELPLALALSGPAAGVAAAGAVAGALGIEHAISFDMGGTTTDVCLVVDGRAEIRADRQLAGRPLRQPMVAVESIGAGGGSIARLDHGALRVGPESAGADPGPACYGRGGTAPTVSDANLVLGYLDAAHGGGGGMTLDRAAAERALAPLANDIGVGIDTLALGIVRVANASMARALRRVTVERGIDGRRCTLIAFGGAGPMHAVELARAFGIGRVLVPAHSSLFSALGCLTAELAYTQQQTVRMPSEAWDEGRLATLRAALRERLATTLRAAGHEDPAFAEIAAVRYSGQSYAVEVADAAIDDPARLGEAFRARHTELYGYATDEPWELEAVRVRAAAPPRTELGAATAEPGGAAATPITTPCRFDETEAVATPRHARDALRAGHRLAGPAIIEDVWSTVVLPPGAALAVDEHGHLHIDAGETP